MKNPGLELQRIPIEPAEPKLYIPTLDALNMYSADEIDKDFYDAAQSVITSCVLIIPVEDEIHPYHNRLHTIDVIEGYLEIATPALEDDSITPREMMLGLIACAAHDTEYHKKDKPKSKDDDNTGKNESRSIEVVLGELSKYRAFNDSDKETVADCIEATIFEGIGECGEILQRSSERTIAKYVVDADLYNLAMLTDNAIDRFTRFFCEDSNIPFIPEKVKLPKEFIEFEIKLLRAHTFNTRHARSLWNKGIKLNIEKLEELLKKAA